MTWQKRLGCIGFGTLVTALVLFVLWSKIDDADQSTNMTVAKNDVIQLVNSIRGFYTEYGRYPFETNKVMLSDGKLLVCLQGKDSNQNPRRIVFLEIPSARKKHRRWVGGLNPGTGEWVDPWGHPYWLKIDADYDGFVDNPYRENAGPAKLHAPVIVWSSGKDGIFGNPKIPGQFQGSGDILSWQ